MISRLIRHAHIEAATVLVLGIGLITGILLARILGPTGRGQIAIYVAVAQTVVLFATLSLDKGLAYVLQRPDASDESMQDKIFRSLKLWMPGCSLLASFVAVAAASVFNFDLPLAALLVISCAMGVQAEFLCGWLIGKKNLAVLGVFRVANSVIWLLGIGLLVVLPIPNDNVLWVAATYLVAVAIAVLFVSIRTGFPYSSLRFPASGLTKLRTSIVKYGIGYHPSTVLAFLSFRLDILLLPFIATDYEVGIYAVAVTPAMTVLGVRSALVVRGLANQKYVNVRLQVAFLAAVLLAVAALPWLIPLLFGQQYSEAVVPAQILVVGAVFDLFSGALGAKFAAIGRLTLAALIQGFVVALIIVGFMFLGATGSTQLVDVALVVTGARLFVGFASLLVLYRMEKTSVDCSTQRD